VSVAHDREKPEDLVVLQPIHGQDKMPFDLQMDDGIDDISWKILKNMTDDCKYSGLR
jgi:hypothetical protein